MHRACMIGSAGCPLPLVDTTSRRQLPVIMLTLNASACRHLFHKYAITSVGFEIGPPVIPESGNKKRWFRLSLLAHHFCISMSFVLPAICGTSDLSGTPSETSHVLKIKPAWHIDPKQHMQKRNGAVQPSHPRCKCVYMQQMCYDCSQHG